MITVLCVLVGSVVSHGESNLVLQAGEHCFMLTPISTTAPLLESARVISGGNQVLAAIQLYKAAAKQGIVLSKVDISTSRHIEATLSDGKIVRIWWVGMGEDTAESRSQLRTKLVQITSVLQHNKANQIRIFDATGPDQISGAYDRPSSVTPAKSKTVVYQVGKGDDLYAIAMMFGVSVADLKNVNSMMSEDITEGQELKIPIKEKIKSSMKK